MVGTFFGFRFCPYVLGDITVLPPPSNSTVLPAYPSLRRAAGVTISHPLSRVRRRRHQSLASSSPAPSTNLLHRSRRAHTPPPLGTSSRRSAVHQPLASILPGPYTTSPGHKQQTICQWGEIVLPTPFSTTTAPDLVNTGVTFKVGSHQVDYLVNFNLRPIRRNEGEHEGSPWCPGAAARSSTAASSSTTRPRSRICRSPSMPTEWVPEDREEYKIEDSGRHPTR